MLKHPNWFEVSALPEGQGKSVADTFKIMQSLFYFQQHIPGGTLQGALPCDGLTDFVFSLQYDTSNVR